MRGWLVFAVVLSVPAIVLGQADDSTDLQEDARLRFELGERAYNRGEFAQAAQEFEAAYQLSNRPPLLYNAYLAYRDGQEEQQAADALRRYLAAAGDIRNRARLEETLRGLDAELAGTPRDSEGPETPRASGGASVPIGPIVVLGAGAAVGIAAIITGALALGRNDELSAACPDDFCPSEDARAIESDVATLSIATDVLWPIAVAALAAGVIWLAVDLSSLGERALRVGCGPGGCTARLEGTFR